MNKTISPGADLPGIQMLRAVAALAVVVHHTLEESNGAVGRFSPDWLTTLGAAGVDIFFVISGFIMLHVTFRTPMAPLTPGDFLRRRATRIYPLFWLCCLTMLLLRAVGFLSHHQWSVADVLTSLTLVPSQNKILAVSWTLVYEVYFYVVLSLTLPVRSKSASVIMCVMAITGVSLAGHLLADGPVTAFLANPIALEFCMGLLLAWMLPRLNGSKPLCLALCVWGFGLLTAAALFVPHPNTNGLTGLGRVVAWGVPATGIVCSALWIGRPRRAFARFAALLGDASYALYLTHGFVMLGYAKLLHSTALGEVWQALIAPLVVGVAVLVALGVHWLVERPLLLLFRSSLMSGLVAVRRA